MNKRNKKRLHSSITLHIVNAKARDPSFVCYSQHQIREDILDVPLTHVLKSSIVLCTEIACCQGFDPPILHYRVPHCFQCKINSQLTLFTSKFTTTAGRCVKIHNVITKVAPGLRPVNLGGELQRRSSKALEKCFLKFIIGPEPVSTIHYTRHGSWINCSLH